MAAGHVGILGKKAATGSYDPLSITWAHACWAEDPNWTNPGDGNGVASWNNAGTQGVDADQANASFRPLYRSSYANLNNQPAIEFDGVNDWLSMTGATDLSQPNHVYAIGYGSASGGATILDQYNASSKRHLLRVRSGSTLQMYAGTSAAPGTSITGAYQVAALFNTTASTIRANGQSHTGLNVGTQPLGVPAMGTDTATYYTGAISFIGIKNAALTSGELNDLDAWAVSHYGVPSL